MSQIFVNLKLRSSYQGRNDRGSQSIEQGLIASSGAAAVGAMAFALADSIEKGFQIVLSAMP